MLCAMARGSQGCWAAASRYRRERVGDGDPPATSPRTPTGKVLRRLMAPDADLTP